VDQHTWLAERFEENRSHPTAVAYRMLGALIEADDAVQEAWVRLARSDSRRIENLGGWLDSTSRSSTADRPARSLGSAPETGDLCGRSRGPTV
jgi:DNA-directed RNA polymerase specialized sigma24 family protein